MLHNIIYITHPIEPDGHSRTDIDYYVKNEKIIATLVIPLKHLQYKNEWIKVEDISKDNILKYLNR